MQAESIIPTFLFTKRYMYQNQLLSPQNRTYSGTVNGVDVSQNLMVDNSNPSRDVIHVMIPKKDLVRIADLVNKSPQASNGGSTICPPSRLYIEIKNSW